jgi:uncharacterized protein YijF (DUF1287 family)
MKNICDVCKSLLGFSPKLVKKVKQGMKLESWYKYNNVWNKRDEHCNIEIIRVVENMIFFRRGDRDEIEIYHPKAFLYSNDGYVEIKQNEPTNPTPSNLN